MTSPTVRRETVLAAALVIPALACTMLVSGIAVYRLPFWHYTTPLVARRGAEATASRWVALATYRYA
jgi:hypothetical protein